MDVQGTWLFTEKRKQSAGDWTSVKLGLDTFLKNSHWLCINANILRKSESTSDNCFQACLFRRPEIWCVNDSFELRIALYSIKRRMVQNSRRCFRHVSVLLILTFVYHTPGYSCVLIVYRDRLCISFKHIQWTYEVCSLVMEALKWLYLYDNSVLSTFFLCEFEWLFTNWSSFWAHTWRNKDSIGVDAGVFLGIR